MKLGDFLFGKFEGLGEVDEALGDHALAPDEFGQLERHHSRLPRLLVEGLLEQRDCSLRVAEVSVQETQRAIGEGRVELVPKAFQQHLFRQQVVTQSTISFPT